MAGRGFGRAMAEAFAREGARVAANYLGSRAGAEAVVAEAGRSAPGRWRCAVTWRARTT
jgi:3-oxoacyl-[acyl-carrier protein] reductase